jgi:hypothetical protein
LMILHVELSLLIYYGRIEMINFRAMMILSFVRVMYYC